MLLQHVVEIVFCDIVIDFVFWGVGASLDGYQPVVFEVLGGFLDTAALVRSRLQHSSVEAHEAWRKLSPLRRNLCGLAPLPHRVFAEERVFVVGELPGEVAGQGAEDEDSEGPHVGARLHRVALALERFADFGRCVRNAGAHLAHHRARSLGHAKVHELDSRQVFIEHEDIFWLDVSVNEVFAVHEFQCAGDLFDDHFALALREPDLRRDGLEQVSERRVLLREHVRRRRLERDVKGVEDGPVWRQIVAVVELAQEVLELGARFGEDLERDARVRLLAAAQQHLPVRAAAQFLERRVALVELVDLQQAVGDGAPRGAVRVHRPDANYANVDARSDVRSPHQYESAAAAASLVQTSRENAQRGREIRPSPSQRQETRTDDATESRSSPCRRHSANDLQIQKGEGSRQTEIITKDVIVPIDIKITQLLAIPTTFHFSPQVIKHS